MAAAVNALLNSLRDPYRPGSGPVVQPWITPGRRTLIVFRRNWPIVSLAVISGVIVAATLPLLKDITGFLMALGIAALYAAWTGVFYLLEHRSSTASLRFQQNMRGLRKIGTITGLTVTLWFLPAASPELWLLYLIPMVTVGVDVDRRWAMALVFVTMGLLLISAFELQPWPPDLAGWHTDLRDGAIRAVIGGYIGFTSYLLARCLAYQSKLSGEALRSLLALPETKRWPNAVDLVANLIADLFSEPGSPITANVLVYDPEHQKTRLAASSRPDGQALAQSNFDFSSDKGVTSWAAVHDEPCFLNDTEFDPEGRFYATKAFGDTRSALAVPFRMEGERRAILEIESPMPDNVAYEDLQIMELIATYLVGAHQTSEWVEFHRQLVDLGKELADRIIKVDDIGETLARIGAVARELIDADAIGFHYRNPKTGQIEQRRTVGELLFPEITGAPVNAPDSLVSQLMEVGEVRFFPEAQMDAQLTRRLEWHRERNLQPFVIREKIASCAAIPLIVGKERLGLMWINYRNPQDFPAPLQYSMQMLAPFAALAIKGGVQSALAERQRRAKLQRDLHDSLSARLNNAARALDRLNLCEPGTLRWKETLQLAQLSVKWATTVVVALLGEREWLTLGSIVTDLQALAEVTTRIYGIPVHMRATTMPDVMVGYNSGNELLFACNEAINNALRHAQATQIELSVQVVDNQLQVVIYDDGLGFELGDLKRVNGINNMRARVEESLGGRFSVRSSPGEGTCITFEVPLHRSEKIGRR